MIQDKKVTIILPTRNESGFLGKSIESCLKQTHSNMELIVIDDASAGMQIKETVKSFEDKRIKYYRNTVTRGTSYCINSGFKKSEGSYITWTSDADYFDDTAIEKMLRHLIVNNEKCVYTSFYCFKNDFPDKKSLVRLYDTNLMAGNCFECVLFERDVFVQTGSFDTSICFTQYYDYLLRVAKKFNLSFLNEPVFYSRLHNFMLTSSDINNFRYSIEFLMVQYKNNVISKEKVLEGLVETSLKYIAESVKGNILLDFSLKSPSLYKPYIMQMIDDMYFKKHKGNKNFASLKKTIDKMAVKIEEKISGHKTQNLSVRRKIIIDLMRFFLENELYDIHEECKFILRNNFELDFYLFANLAYQEFNYKFSNACLDENTFLKAQVPSSGSFLEPGIKKDFYFNLAKFKESKPFEYYAYRFKDEFGNTGLYNKPDDVFDHIKDLQDFLNDSRTKKFVLDMALSLASSNEEINQVQKKIQEFYKASL